MAHRKVGQLLVVGLIVLLGVQLTGLSCLDEWRLGVSSGSMLDNPRITDGAIGSGEVADDSCPCHLAFVSIPTDAHQVSHPVSFIDRHFPVTPPLVSPFSLFHPPLNL
jgi:hypothetical protein